MADNSMFLVPNASQKENSRLANIGMKPGPGRYETRLSTDVRLAQDGPGERWQVYIGKGQPLPATDIEVSLWLRLQVLLREGQTARRENHA